MIRCIDWNGLQAVEFAKGDVLGKVHSLPISEIDFEVEISSRRECMSRWRMNHL